MNFKVGTNPADWRVPYAFASDIEEVVSRAIADLVSLLTQRAKTRGKAAKVRGRELTLEHDWSGTHNTGVRVNARPRSLALRTFKQGSLYREVAEACLGREPLLDSGILDPWFLRGGAGKELLETLTQLYEKSLEAQLKVGETGEPLTYFMHLAVLQLVRSKKELIKDATTKALHYESLDRAVATAMANVVRVAARAAVHKFQVRGVPTDLTQTNLALSISAAPLTLMASARTMAGAIDYNPLLRSTPNWYGLTFELAAALDEVYAALGPGTTIGARVDELTAAIGAKGELLGAVLDVGEMLVVRGTAISYLRDHDNQNDPRYYQIADAMLHHWGVGALMRDAARIGGAIRALGEVAGTVSGDRAAWLLNLQETLRQLQTRKKLPKTITLSSRGLPDGAEAIVRGVAQRYLLLRYDITAQHYVESALLRTENRRLEANFAELAASYEDGRVYMFTLDPRPVRREQVERLEAHLFLDMKGYTKRTVVDRALNVADFMKQHFFKPILDCAHRYVDREGAPLLRLNNLLGDAVTFSGDVVSLTLLSDDLERIFQQYEQRLANRDAGRAEHEARQELDAEFVTLNTLLTRAQTDCDRRIAELAPQAATDKVAHTELLDLHAQREELLRRLEQLTTYYQERKQHLEGSRIEVGLFVSYGPAAEVVRLVDPVYGPQNVAVAEKINESARGTARNDGVRAKKEALLAVARSETGRDLSLPYNVYVDRAFRLVLPDDLSSSLLRTVTGHPENAEKLAQEVGQRLFSELTDGPVTRHGGQRLLQPHVDIYNVGRAFSREAVEAFLRETATTRVGFRKTELVAGLHPEIQERFYFDEQQLDFVISLPLTEKKARPVLFRFAGELTFRGFEASHSTSIYEMLKPGSPFFKALLQFHLKDWSEQLQQGRVVPVLSL